MKNNNIEALRGLAIILVLISHIPNLLYWNADVSNLLSDFSFASGVDLFFCISGFVITKAYYEKLQISSHQNLTSFARESGIFLIRRVFRIMPAAIIWLLIVCFLAVYFNRTGIFGTLEANVHDLISVVLNVSNFHFARCIADGYISPTCGYNGIYWSISLEEQFYFLFPLFVLVRKRWLGLLTLAVLITLIGIERNIFVWFTRVDGLLLGVSLGLLSLQPWHSRFRIEAKYCNYIWALILAVTCPAIVGMPLLKPWIPRLYPELITLFCLVLVALASVDHGNSHSAGVVRRTFIYIGSRSFSLYLAHNPVFWITREIASHLGALKVTGAPNNPAMFAILAIGGLLIVSELSYRYIEVPFRELGKQLTTNRFSGILHRTSIG